MAETHTDGAKPKFDANFLYTQLVEKLKGRGSDVKQRIDAHVKAVSGKESLVGFHNNGASHDEKVEVYRTCIRAVLTGDYSTLKTPPPPPVVEVETVAPAPKVVEPEPPPVDRPAIPAGSAEQAVAALGAALQAFQRAPQVDETAVRRIVDGAIKEALDGFKGPSIRIEFPSISGEFKALDGLMHPQVPQIACWLRAGVPVWAHSPAGSGKTHMARQIAQLLEIEPYVMSVDPTLTVGKIMGYRNVANGEFVEGFAYKPFKCGGLLAADEKDTGDAGVMASANAMLSNGHYMFPNGETVTRHEMFRYLALANTKGMGAVAGYTARNRLDAATLDRFAIIEVKYDEGLEMAMSCGRGQPGAPWKPGKPADVDAQERYVKWVQAVRRYVGTSVLVSPRAASNGCKALRAGIPLQEVADALVFKLCTQDTIDRIKANCRMPL